MRDGLLGALLTPLHSTVAPEGVDLVLDNGCYSQAWPGERYWWRWLTRQPVEAVKFAVAPDVVGDAGATLHRSSPWLARIAGMGMPVGYAAQDGATAAELPWENFDVLFLGGTTDWKLGPQARELVRVARVMRKPVHMGRVNSLVRLRYAALIGCASVDGTHVVFGVNKKLPELKGWLRELYEAPVRL